MSMVSIITLITLIQIAPNNPNLSALFLICETDVQVAYLASLDSKIV